MILISVFYKQRGEVVYAYKNILSPVDISGSQKFSEIFNWLQKNTPKDSAIYVLGEDINNLITIYTPDNIYFSTDAGLSLMSDVELENRWVIQHYFDPVNDKYVIDHEREIWANKFIETYQSKESRRKILQLITGKQYPDTVLINQTDVDRVVNQYKKIQSLGFEKALKTYSVDYIILDKSYNQYSKLVAEFNFYKFLDISKQIGDTVIYKVK